MTTSSSNTATAIADLDSDVIETFSLESAFFSNPKDIADIIVTPHHGSASTEAAKNGQGIPKVADLFVYKQQNYIRETPFVSLQKWEGVVTAVSKRGFRARLVDLNSQDEEFADIPTAEVTDEDAYLLKPGAIFYWNIGYSYRSGTKSRASIIRFKRMPRISRKEEEAAERRASILWDKLNRGNGAGE